MKAKSFISRASLSLALACLCNAAFADGSPWSLTPQASTLGAGINLGYQVSPSWNVRANVNGFNLDRTFHADSMDYDASVRLRTAGLLADYFPFDNGFHITGGAYYNGNYVNGTGYYNDYINVRVGKQVVKINPNDYGNLRFNAHYQRFSPYLGLGYHALRQKGWSFALDLGVLYQGNARVNFDVPSEVESLGSQKLNDAIERDKQTVRNRLNDWRWYPVVSLGVTYRF